MKRKFVEIQLAGGLGNQLFQYCAGQYLATRLNTGLVVNGFSSQHGRTGHENWLGEVGLPVQRVKQSHGALDFPFLLELGTRSVRYLLSNRVFKTTAARIRFLSYYHSPVVGNDPALRTIDRPVFLSGYFQTHEYFDYLQSKGLAPRISTDKFSPWFKELSTRIKEQKSLIIHIRRGDYAKHSQDFGLLTAEYYARALDTLSRTHQWNQVFVFSDEPSLAKSELGKISEADWTFVEPPSGTSAIESLVLMSLGDLIVIGNSTFSWWAAKLSQAQEVVRPSAWFRLGETPNQLFPEAWLEAESSWSL